MSQNWQEASDAELLQASACRNQLAFAELIRRYQTQVYRVAWRLNAGHADTEDIAQETFLKLWNNPSQLREAGALKGWLMRVASNLTMDRYRMKPMQDLEQAAEVPDQSPSAAMQRDQTYVSKTIDAAIATLPDRQKLALIMVHFEQMTNIAAAQALEVSVDALESLLARARRALKAKLSTQGPHLLAALSSGYN